MTWQPVLRRLPRCGYRADPLEWDGDFTTDGRFAIQVERVRGEPAWYELWVKDDACRAIAKRLNLELGAYGDKSKMRRYAQRLADLALEAEILARYTSRSDA